MFYTRVKYESEPFCDTVLGMEKEGFIRCVENIQNNLKLSIAVISTD